MLDKAQRLCYIVANKKFNALFCGAERKGENSLKNIYAEKARHGLTLEDLAKAVGISRVSVSNKLAGKYDWTLPEMVRLKNYFNELGSGVTLDYLFDPSYELTASAR